ncbi:MAG: Rrf2 family transcriptional regulator [Lachnospiraceae bacterium]|nr:Rrf2 family transcriptional regulator [Lachnospiraceae bacterium]
MNYIILIMWCRQTIEIDKDKKGTVEVTDFETYNFLPVLPEGYALPEGVELPFYYGQGGSGQSIGNGCSNHAREKKIKQEKGNDMQLNISTDYAIRAVLYMVGNTEKCEYVTLEQMAANMQISKASLVRALTKFRKKGWVESAAGVRGGYRFVGNPEQISLYDILNVMEGTIHINRCLESDHYCSRGGTKKNCPVYRTYQEMQRRMVEYLSSATIASLLSHDAKET